MTSESHGPEPESPPESPPEGALDELELHEERRASGSAHAVAAGAALLALTRAARCFTLYDPTNKVVRALIASYRERFLGALAAHGTMALEVHPFELLLGREVVYLERDRERSLAFRLFRDGVRRLSFAAETSWDELLRLLSILSIRYTGVRQQEDDLVTLLRKAGFEHVHVAAIEGFVPEEERQEPALDPALLGGARERFDPPPQWDTPLPPFPEAAPLLYRPVTEALLARLRAEEAEDAVPAQALRGVSELLSEGDAEGEEAGLAFALEVREYLLVEGRPDALVELARLVLSALGSRAEAVGAFLAGWLDARTLGALVASLPQGATELPAPLAQLVDAAPPATTDRLFELLAAEADGPRAPLVRLVLARSCRRNPQALVGRLRSASGAAGVALFRLLESVDPHAVLQVSLEIATKGDAALQGEALRHLGGVAFTPEVARGLHHLVESPHEAVRLLALPVLARGGARVFPALLAHVQKHAARLGPAEAESVGQALARSSAREALATFDGWLRPKGGGLLGRLVKMQAPPTLQRIALAGLRGTPGPEATALVALLAEHGEGSLRPEAQAVLAARPRADGARHG